MRDPSAPPPPIDDFLALSREYADALEALRAIEAQAETIVALGGSGELRSCLDQFLALARRARDRAAELEMLDLAAWFQELIDRAGRVEHTLEV